MLTDPDCMFCKIIAQKIPSSKVYEDDKVYAFKDIQAQAPTHYLFVPKVHVSGLDELALENFDLMADLYRAVKKVVQAKQFEKSGFRTVINTGRDGGQTVFHLHLHLLGGTALGGNMAGV